MGFMLCNVVLQSLISYTLIHEQILCHTAFDLPFRLPNQRLGLAAHMLPAPTTLGNIRLLEA